MSTDWQRPHWQPSDDPDVPAAELHYLVPGSAGFQSAAPLGPGLHSYTISRARSAAWFQSHFDSPGRGDDLRRALGDLAEELRTAPEAISVSGGFVEPPDLDYLRAALDTVSGLLRGGGLGVLDFYTGRWWSAEEWLGRFTGEFPFAVEDHVRITVSPGRQPAPALWTRTRGLNKFARPDLRVRHPPGWWGADDPVGRAAGELLRDIAGQLCRGARIPAHGVPLAVPSCARACACVATPGYLDSERYLEGGLSVEVVDWDADTGTPGSDLRSLLAERLGGEPARTQEGAFLLALEEHPADDTTRLIYADWLEERGEAARAEYLRLEVQLAQAPPKATACVPLEARLGDLVSDLDPRWLALAGKRHEVVLLGYPPARKINTIKMIREVTGLGLKEAKTAAEAPLPTVIYRGVARVVAERDAKRCRNAGMTVAVRVCR
jgi:uncharacterized protein (TIGR02996 family)